MVFWLQVAYPFFLILWVFVHMRLNKRAQQQSRHYSTKVALDDRIPFVPGFAPLYFSAFILGTTGYLILFTHENLPQVVLGYLILFTIGSLSYMFIPCRAERQEDLIVTNISTYLISTFQRRSEPFNSFPSMHVGYCLFSALVVLRFSSLELGGILLIWAGLVAISTLFTKQHHLVDVMVGAVLAVIVSLVI
jgi:membrane-associated phospholipid phosphatase